MSRNTQLKACISPGELIDKISILEIKKRLIPDPDKLKNINAALECLKGVRSKIPDSDELSEYSQRLSEVNESLWVLEDEARDFERRQEFGSDFIRVARSIYQTNDERAHIKREIDIFLHSTFLDEKSYNEPAQDKRD